jgi:hypothetical protein
MPRQHVNDIELYYGLTGDGDDTVVFVHGSWTDLGLAVFVDNCVALEIYRRLGFVVDGTMFDCGFKRGKYVDAHVMARLNGTMPSDRAGFSAASESRLAAPSKATNPRKRVRDGSA